MASPLNFPHFSPPPPPPPHVVPPPSPDSDTTVIVIVFVSFGCLLFLAFFVVLLCCFFFKKKKKTTQETDIIHADEHLRINEVIVPGPHGPQAAAITIDDDVHIDEVIRKDEKFGEGVGTKSKDNIASAMEEGVSTSTSSDHHHLEHKP